MDKWFLQNPEGRFYAVHGWVTDHKHAMAFGMESDAKSHGLAQKLIGAVAVKRDMRPAQPQIDDLHGERRIFGYGAPND